MDNVVSQRQFADMIGVSEAAVSGMVKNVVIIPGQPVGAWLRDYCAHIREQAAGRAAAGDLDLAAERARLAKEQADKIAMQNAVSRNELAPVVLLEEVLAKTAAKIAGLFDAIPGHIRRRFPALPSETIDMISGDIAKVRNVVAAMSLSDLDDDSDQPQAAADAEVIEA